MVEYYTQAIVLGREVKNEQDAVVNLFTKDLGRIFALAKSLRRITSKLSGHLVEGNLIQVRVAEKNNFQIIDALSERIQPSPELFQLLRFIEKITPYNQADLALWYEIEKAHGEGRFTRALYRRLLEISGFNPQYAKCDNCGKNDIAYFLPTDIIFLCLRCSRELKVPLDELVQI